MEHFDLIVVGTGFASSFFLKKYLEKSPGNKRVLVLERGILFPYEQRLKNRRGEPILDEFKNRKDANFEYDNEDKTWAFDPNFGGSSNCWTGCTPRFMPNDFKLKSLYGVGQDWPVTYNELEPYYCEVETIMQVGGPSTTPFPKSQAYPLPPQKLTTVDKLIQAKYPELYISQPTARATIPVNNRNGCCTSAVCDLCPVNSKFTIENGLNAIYKDPRVTIQYDAQVYSLHTENNTIKSVLYKQGGKDQEVKGEIVALGANAIFNPHILLSAGDANYFTGRGISDQRGTFAYFYFNKVNNVGGSSMITANGYMLYDGAHRKDRAACLIESFNDPIIRNEPGKWRQIAKLKFVFEDLPGDDNRVMVSKDPLKPKVVYTKHDAYVDRAMEKLKDDIHSTFSFLPLDKIELDGYFQKSEFHICATTRMGHSAKDSVIDKNLIHHQYRNLFVLGSGAFPTITPANPTLTLSALSLMAANNSF
jgi:choline dehydrogenase-like flavoprotein